MLKGIIIVVVALLSAMGFGQNLVVDSSFNRLGDFYQTEGLHIRWHKDGFSRGEIELKALDDRDVAAFRFRVNSVQVDPNFIVAQLTEELLAGQLYELTISVRKDRLSPFSINALQVYLGSSFSQNTSFLHGAAERQLLSFDLEHVNSDHFTDLKMTYEAQGGEEYIFLGSILQRFNLVESTKLGLLMADRTYREMPYNSTYYISKVKVVSKKDSGKKVEESLDENFYNSQEDLSNLVVNGGAETELKKRYFTNEVTHGTSGSLIAPYVYSLTSFSPEVNQLDSNDYRSVYDVSELCYMGDGQFILDALKTNLFHEYGDATWKQEGEEYDTYHIYEKASGSPVSPYAIGEYLVFSLAEPLKKGGVYHWSAMLKMSEGASFGISHLGIHFLESFPENVYDSIWQRLPEDILGVEHLATSEAWSEFNLDYTARGGEKFVVLGHLPAVQGIVRNQHFKRQFQSACGPHESNCLMSRYVYYKDSLFARFQLDNVVLTEASSDQHYAIGYPPGKRVQLEIIFSEVKKGDLVEKRLEKVKKVLISAQQVLRVEDAICIVDQRKKEPVILEPNAIINKKKILRKIGKPKTARKIKHPELNTEIILFGDGTDEVNLNHLVLIADENLDVSLASSKLDQFTNNGGHLTIFFIGEPDHFVSFGNQFKKFKNINLFNLDQIDDKALVKILLNAN
ncbi:hypothetical protein [Parvicella tangerina]|nr:hypothetical protein [Parvicella tangerina]